MLNLNFNNLFDIQEAKVANEYRVKTPFFLDDDTQIVLYVSENFVVEGEYLISDLGLIYNRHLTGLPLDPTRSNFIRIIEDNNLRLSPKSKIYLSCPMEAIPQNIIKLATCLVAIEEGQRQVV